MGIDLKSTNNAPIAAEVRAAEKAPSTAVAEHPTNQVVSPSLADSFFTNKKIAVVETHGGIVATTHYELKISHAMAEVRELQDPTLNAVRLRTLLSQIAKDQNNIGIQAVLGKVKEAVELGEKVSKKVLALDVALKSHQQTQPAYTNVLELVAKDPSIAVGFLKQLKPNEPTHKTN